jgi:hypothetical protein
MKRAHRSSSIGQYCDIAVGGIHVDAQRTLHRGQPARPATVRGHGCRDLVTTGGNARRLVPQWRRVRDRIRPSRVDADAIDIDVERNVLTVRAERRPIDLGEQATAQLTERPLGVFSRQLFLGDALDTEHIDAGYDNGVLVLRIPIAERAKPRKINVAGRQRTEQKVIAG